MKLDDIAAMLQRCGLGDKEARAFVHLTNMGESKVADLATAAGLKRAETYQILEKLQGRGLVEGTLARPRKFVALPPQRAMEVLVEERANELKSVENLREEAERSLASLSGASAESQAGSFRILQDLNQIGGQLRRTARAAKREVCAVASSRSLFRLLLDEGLEEELEAAHEKGVKLRILTEIMPGQEATVERLLTFADVRHAMVPRPMRFFIADEDEIVQYVTADPMTSGAKETALWIGARDHVGAQRAQFDEMWTEAVPAEGRLEQLRTGKAPPQAQIVKGRFTRVEKAKEMLLRAEREAFLYVTVAEAARLEKSGLRRALEARAKKGVDVRVLVAPGASAPKAGAGVTVREAAEKRALPVLVVDSQEALLVLGEDKGAEGVTALGEYGVWLTLPGPVGALRASFEAAWARAGE